VSVTNTNIVPKNFKLCLTDAYMLNSRMRHLEFKLLSKEPLYYNPGQFISLLIEKNNHIVRRNFSIANPPESYNNIKLEIAATFVPNGIASTTLWNMEPKDEINASGPFGIFVLDQEEVISSKRYILAATGTGVTPYRAMLPSIKNILNNPKTADLKFVLLLGVRNNQELLYAEDFIKFESLNSNFQFIACYSRQTNDTDEYNRAGTMDTHNSLRNDRHGYNTAKPKYEYSGYIQNKLTELDINPKCDTIYLCGNPNMIDAAVRTLEQYNMPRNKIKREKYISSK
jgi:ferredoxin-NADP reductase